MAEDKPDTDVAEDDALGLGIVRLSQWRRMVLRDEGPDLTLPEAAVVLGVSVENVRRRIRAGRLQAYRDEHGHTRVVAHLRPAKAVPEATQTSEQLSRLWEAFKASRVQLEEAIRERQAAMGELIELRQAAAGLQQKVDALAAESNIDRLLELQPARDKVRAQIVDIRTMARKRMLRPPWTLVG